MHALIVDDSPKLAASIRDALQSQGHTADIAATGADGQRLAREGRYDLFILDVMLPDTEGFLICRDLRRMGISQPVLMVSALSAVEHRVAGLDYGADDYVTKPFHYEELMARVRALLRTRTSSGADVLTCLDIELDVPRQEVRVGGEIVELTSKEFALLELFMRNRGRITERSEIRRVVWDSACEEDSNRIDTCVSNLRKKLQVSATRDCIRTVVGSGYRFGEPV